MRTVAALLAAAVVAGCGGTSGATTQPHRTAALRGAASLDGRFAGIPQHGPALGSPRAPYTLVEFADLQCPYCAKHDREILAEVIDRFVRPGRLRLELRPIAVLGPQSSPAAVATVAAGRQDRMWQFADLFYRNQGRENSGYVTDAFLRQIASGVPGLDVSQMLAASRTTAVRAAVESNLAAARTARVTGTPGFRLGRTGGVLEPFEGGALDRDDFVRRLGAAIDA